MAYNIDIKTNYGINCSHWKISKIEKDYVSQSAYIVLYGYPSKEIKDQKNECLEKRYINIYPVDFDEVFGIEKLNQEDMNDIKSLYEFIKENFDEFKDAEIS